MKPAFLMNAIAETLRARGYTSKSDRYWRSNDNDGAVWHWSAALEREIEKDAALEVKAGGAQ